MKTETIHKTEEGKFIIEVYLSISTWLQEDNFIYHVFTQFIPQGKRKPISGVDQTDKLPASVILQAKMDFWNKIKPI